MNPKFQHNGGRAVPVQGRMVTNQSRGRSKSARSRKRDKPLRSEGRNLEDADARDRSVITRGQGMLPTRSPSPSPERLGAPRRASGPRGPARGHACTVDSGGSRKSIVWL